MALYGDLTNDSRVLREAATLAEAGHDVAVYCVAGTAPGHAQFRVAAWIPDRSSVRPDGANPFGRASRRSRIGSVAHSLGWLFGYARNLDTWGRWAVAAAGDVDVWHAHDLTGLLAVGRHVDRPTAVVYDSHEIYLNSGSAARLPAPVRWILSAYEGRLTRRAAALITVNEAYAQVLERLRPRRTVIVRNCPPRWTPTNGPTQPLRDALNVTSMEPVILYHGVFAHHRGIEQLAEAMLEPGLELAHLALLGFGELHPRLEMLAAEPRFRSRIRVFDAVPPSRLLEWVAGADVDVMALENSSLNHWLCTPNKLWESIATGVPVVVSDYPVMHRIVLDDPDGPLGGVCDPVDPRSIATAIRAIIGSAPNERAEFRARCLRAAHERWNWERESSRLVELYASLG
jgi:glycosyltransferase involved in cell wall biosynthesis